MQLSRKLKAFSEFVSVFLKSILNFEHFQTINAPDGWCISEIMDSKVSGEINV